MKFDRRTFLDSALRATGGVLLTEIAGALAPKPASAQANTEQLSSILKQSLQSADVVEFQLRQYLLKRVLPLAPPNSTVSWTAQAKRLRGDALSLIFHGWPDEWVSAPARFEEVG